MRSLLVQASSVEKAVEKAWDTAGQPTEFTIKVHDFGKKGFLGFTKKPAIISIVYEPQKQTSLSKAPRTQQSHRPERTPKRGTTQRRTPSKPIKKERSRPQPQKAAPKKMAKPEARPRPQHQAAPQQRQELQERNFWTDNLIDDIASWINDLTKAMGFNTPFKITSDKKSLTVTFSTEVLPDLNEERLLFSGLSYLLIQFLKKKHKKKYQGYKLMITTTKRAPNPK